MATQLAERGTDPVAIFRQTLTQPAFVEQLKMALPSHIPVERFIRVAQTAVQNNPSLLDPQKVERRSLFGALTKAAQDGLLPDGREGVIVPYRGKAMWQPMVAGIMTKVRRSGEIANWEVAAVFEKDTFERLLGDDQRIYHKPYEEDDPGKVIGAYSIVTLRDGSKSRDYMPRWRIEKARAQATAKDSLMWTSFYDEGAIKTVIKHHSKRLPMSTDIEAIFERDETMATVRRIEPEREPEAQPQSRLDMIEHQIADEDPPVESEVIEEQAEALEQKIDAKPKGRGKNLLDQIAPTPAEAKVAEIKAALEQADAETVEAIVADYKQHEGGFDEEQRKTVEIAISQARARFETAGAK